MKISRAGHESAQRLRQVFQDVRHDMDHASHALDLALGEEGHGVTGYLTKALPDPRPDHQINDPRLIFESDKDGSFGRGWLLAHEDEARHAHHRFVRCFLKSRRWHYPELV